MPYPEYSHPYGLFAAFLGDVLFLCVRAATLPVDEKDEQAGQIIMKNMAGPLPIYLKGEFAEEA
jgi:hypothetical protein